MRMTLDLKSTQLTISLSIVERNRRGLWILLWIILTQRKVPIDAESSEVIHVRLADDVDEVASDDILGLGPRDLNFISTLKGDNRTKPIILHLKASY